MTTLAGISISDSLQETLDGVAKFVPKLIGAFVILLIGWFIAKIIFRVIVKVLKKADFDKLVDKSGLGAPLERAGFADSGVFLAKIIYWLIMFIVIKAAVEALGLLAVQNLVDDLVDWLPKLFVALIIILLTSLVANFVKALVSGATATQSWGNAAASAAMLGVWFIGGMAALDQVEVASDIVDTLFTTVMTSLAGILIIKYGVGGIWAARDRFWPGVYDTFGAATKDVSEDVAVD